MSYTKTGPFVNGGAPGISATFLNNVENWIEQVDNTTVVTVSGSVSGSASLYQFLQGTVKAALVTWNNYKSSGAQNLALPLAFTSQSLWWVGDLQGGTIAGTLSGTSQTFSVMTALALGGGSESAQAYLNNFSLGMLRSGFDTVKLTVSTNAASSLAFIIGS